MQDENDAERVKAFYENGRQELDVLRRSAIVNSLYGGRKLVIERGAPDVEEPEPTLQRGDN